MTNRVHSPTIYQLLFGTVNMFEDLGYGIPRFSLHESIQPLLGRLDVLDGKKILYQLDCVALSTATHLRERTHDVVVA
jgi:hypothetical protein